MRGGEGLRAALHGNTPQIDDDVGARRGEFGEHGRRVLLRLGDVRLVERIDLHRRTGDRRRELPAHEFGTEVDRVIELPLEERMAGGGKRFKARIDVAAVGTSQRGGSAESNPHESAVVAIRLEAPERFAVDGNDADAAQKLMRERTQLEEQLEALSHLERELDDAILQLRTNHLEIGTWLLKTAGEAAHVLAADAALDAHADHWFVREVAGIVDEIGFINQTIVFSKGSLSAEGAGYANLQDF